MIEIVFVKMYKVIEKLGKHARNYLPRGKREVVIKKNSSSSINSIIIEKFSSFFSPFNSWKMFFLIFSFYIFAGLVSRVPIIYPNYWILGVALIFLSCFMFFLGNKIKVKKSKTYKANYDFWIGLFIVGLIGLIVNYVIIGIPLFDSDLREKYHTPLWSISMMFYITGSVVTFSKYRTKNLFWVLLIVSSILSILSGFRTDFALFVAPPVFFAALKNEIKNIHLLLLVLVFLVFIVGIKYVLLVFDLSQSSVGDIVFSRPGFTLYVLSEVVKNVGFFGFTHGRLFFNKLILQFFGVPVAFFGDVVSEIVVNMPRAHASSFVGPLYLEFGLLGVLLISFIIGFFCELPQKIYNLTKNDFFLALYTVNLSILLVWIETGPIQYYLVFLFFVIGILCLRKMR